MTTAPRFCDLAASRSGAPSAVGRRAAARHLADLDLAGRRAVVAGLGEKEFRAGQLSHHYFGRLVRDPAADDRYPGRSRDALAAALLPTLLTPVRELSCDGGTTRKRCGGCTTAPRWRAC